MSTFLLTAIAMLAFAANSLLCRLALAAGLIDAGSFTLIRLLSGAATLIVIMLLRGNWRSQIPTIRFSLFRWCGLIWICGTVLFRLCKTSSWNWSLVTFWCRTAYFARTLLVARTTV